MIPIATLRHRLTLEAPDDQPDGAGGVVRVWNPVGQVWASIEPLGASETVRADMRVGALSHRVVQRHRDGLDLNHRFRLGQRIFTPRTLRDRDERGRYLECLAGEERP